jgi:4-amino-4-deoxy-L-arabinose transferase-like glycosyltransferase/membrane-associated phospholipid phosphatase
MIWRKAARGQNFFLAASGQVDSAWRVLQEFDTAILRWVHSLSGNTVVDFLVTIFNGGAWFKRVGIVLGLLAIWKGNTRLRICMVFLGLALAMGDGVFIGGLKKLIERPRPYVQFQDLKPLGRGDAYSMPSGHAANSMAMALVVATFYRRLRYAAFFFAFMVSFARVYSGVHFPTDVLVGATLALLYTSALLWGVEWLWTKKAALVAPGLVERVPSLLRSPDSPKQENLEHPSVGSYGGEKLDWVRLGWYLIGFVLVARLWYLASGKIELSEDEAYQWLWSKHLALSYYSKPPLIAYSHWLSTRIWGDSAFGVRFFSPVLASLGAGILLTFLSRNTNPRTAFFTVVAALATPMLAVGATLMTIDAWSVVSWTVAMVLVWRAVEKDSTNAWALAGATVGLGMLAKYVNALQWICVLLFLSLYAPARRQFRRPGFYLAIAISALSLLPVIIWNAQNDWITLTHLNERSGLNQQWRYRYGFMLDFVLQEIGLLNPVFFALTIWACLKFWKARTPFQTFLFCMGAPLFVGYFLYTVRARVQPNWIAPAILPLFALAATFWEPRWDEVRRVLRPVLKIGFALGLIAVVFLHDTNLTQKAFSVTLPAKLDPLARVRGWSALAKVANEERVKANLDFIIGGHYGVTSLMTFYTPEARKAAANNTLIYALASDRPVNQFYFWPKYLGRVGDDALFVQREGSAIPAELEKQFERIEDLGVRDAQYRGRTMHQVHLYACRNLRAQVVPSERR